MKPLLLSVALFMAASCAASTPSKFDQAHLLYNQAASVALAYAEQPDADPVARQRIADVIIRTGPVVNKCSLVLEDPRASESEKELYSRWAIAILDEAIRQLTEEALRR